MARTRYEAFHTHPPCAELTLRQMRTMMVIHEQREVSIKELAEALNVSPPSASSMVDRLLGLGLVEREPSQEDRREVCVRLSPQGEVHSREMEGHFLAFISDLIERVGEEYATQWCAVYARLREVLESYDAPPATGDREDA
jgi:DNA-binding MarR family transcriptional regulator